CSGMRISGRTPLFKKDVGNGSLLMINVVGLILSVYAYHVNVSKQAEPDYRAFCDLSPTMSCSRVLTSP
ncbi:Vitamin K epoxide reductase complex subunit 1-like protein 1, partial [Sarracenia purpurea var. burkii]